MNWEFACVVLQHGEPLSPAASTLAMVLTRGLSMEQQKSSRDSLQYSSGYSTQTNTPSCSEDTIPSQGQISHVVTHTLLPQKIKKRDIWLSSEISSFSTTCCSLSRSWTAKFTRVVSHDTYWSTVPHLCETRRVTERQLWMSLEMYRLIHGSNTCCKFCSSAPCKRWASCAKRSETNSWTCAFKV